MATRRLAGLGLALVGLLSIVALAGGGSRPLGVGDSREHVGPQFFDYAFTSLVLAFVAGLGITLLAARGLRGQLVPERRRRAWWQNVAVLAAAVLLLALAARVHLLPRIGNPAGADGGGKASAPRLPQAPTAGGRDLRFKWAEAAAAGGALLAVGAWLLVARRMRGSGGAEAGDPVAPAGELSAALDDALHDLRAEIDLRRAVIAAYARMEGALGASGLPRRRSEAPLEYLERTLVSLRASGAAVSKLTYLFEWAKFSHHPVDAGMRDEAVAALVRVRDELRAAS